MMVFQQFKSMIGVTGEERHSEPTARTSNEQQVFLLNLAKCSNKHTVDNPGMSPQDKADNLGRITSFGIGVGSLYLQEAFGYPFIILRRQCQVNHMAIRYHIDPFSLFRVIGRIHHRQGFSVFWKGWGSTCIVNGVTILTEVVICELLNTTRKAEQRKDKEENSSLKFLFAHELLKGISLLVTLPLFSASLVDSVQSLALDQSRSVFTFFKDAAYRLVGLYVSRGHGRLLPIFSLVAPSIVYGIMKYSVKSFLAYFLLKIYKARYKIDDKMVEQNMKKIYYTELMSNLIASFLTDCFMFPFETAIVRIHLQGTRTIIDDTDKGIGVVPLCTNYDGLFDCIHTIHREEGIGGFYKGFGALILQYVIQSAVVKLAKPFYCVNM